MYTIDFKGSGQQAELYKYRKQTTKRKPNIKDVHEIRKKEIHNRAKTILEVEIQTVDDPFGDDQI